MIFELLSRLLLIDDVVKKIDFQRSAMIFYPITNAITDVNDNGIIQKAFYCLFSSN